MRRPVTASECAKQASDELHGWDVEIQPQDLLFLGPRRGVRQTPSRFTDLLQEPLLNELSEAVALTECGSVLAAIDQGS